MNASMIKCRRCETYFEPDNDVQAVCDSCGKADPAFAHVAGWERLIVLLAPKAENRLEGVDAGWDPVTPDQEQWFYQNSEVLSKIRFVGDKKEPHMLVCDGCQKKFEPGDRDQAVCDNCRDTNPGLADRMRMAGDCEPLTPEEKMWAQIKQDEQDMQEEWDAAEAAWFNQPPEEHTL